MATRELMLGTAVLGAVAAGAGVAVGAVAAMRGETSGPPGISKALSRLGTVIGGGMLAGIAVAAGAATLVGIAVYQGVNYIDMAYLEE